MAVQTALETRQTGEAYVWTAPGITSGTVTPLRTWRSLSGHWCRAFEERLQLDDGRRDTASGVRCRGDGGRWLEPNG